MADDYLEAIQRELDRDTARALGPVRRSAGEQRNAETEAWLSAGDNLAEKAIAALDTGDEERAAKLVRRIIALPVVDESTPSGLMAVNVVLYREVIDPPFEDCDARGLLDLPLRLLPTLDGWAADALRHALASFADYELPAAMVRRIRAVVSPERRFDEPFQGVSEEDLPAAVTSVLRLVLQLRTEQDSPASA